MLRVVDYALCTALVEGLAPEPGRAQLARTPIAGGLLTGLSASPLLTFLLLGLAQHVLLVNCGAVVSEIQSLKETLVAFSSQPSFDFPGLELHPYALSRLIPDCPSEERL